ncbi:Non-ribosomal peptide synthetase modules-related protein [Gordonia terrae C-6]|uniref:Non-ribosomal peptide synthetase modules-related protein n=1 Tax=Gordonia terrae C-6 TaxID=1316928 RepID=R7Y8R0_9ACTN|nr:condensation domain-containing protein [Gordonia terrae]EON32416.1 Non-ribosomal peptide synthetase modules-related protein [Gordonia terrae C-6]
MKFTELSDYPVPAGTVTIWTPTTRTDLAGWQSDPRPFTYDQSASIRRSAAGDDDENSWLGAIFEIDDELDAERFESCLNQWLTRHEALLSTADPTSDDPHHGRRTYRGGHLGVDTEVAGGFDSGDDVRELLTGIFDARLAPTRWPHCIVATISSPRGGFCVAFAADHVVMDAYSILLSMSEIRRLYISARHGASTEMADVGSHLDFSVHDRVVGLGLTGEHPAVSRWRTFLDRSADAPGFGLPLVRPHLETGDRARTPRQRGVSEYVATDRLATFVTSAARTSGHGTQTAVFAALAVTLRALTGRDTLRLTMPMHTRTEARYAGSVGWYVGLAPLEVDLAGSVTFDDALTATAAAIDEVRHLPLFPYQRIVELLGTGGEPDFVVSYLDIRHVPGAAEWDAARAQILRGGSRSDREVYLWIARVPGGITVSARHPGHDPADASIRDLITTYAAILRTLATEGTALPLSSYTCATFAGTAALDDARPA